MVLVAGATGRLGGEVCRVLVAGGQKVRALVRKTSDPARVAALEQLGVQTVIGDLKDRGSLAAACRDAETVISTASATGSRQPGDTLDSVDRAGQRSLVSAAMDAGVAHFVYVSFAVQEDAAITFPLLDAKTALAEQIKESGMTYTILQPANFMEVWLSPAVGFDFPNLRATLLGAGTARVSWISLGDVAAVAVAALDHPAARNAEIPLGGPEALSPLAVVRIFEEVTGRTFSVEYVPEAVLMEQKRTAADPMQESLAALRLLTARGCTIDMSWAVETFGVHLTTVRDYARRVGTVRDNRA